MTPEAATRLQAKLLREMTVAQRMIRELESFEVACELARECIRSQHPKAGEQEVEHWLRKRLELGERIQKNEL